MLIQKHNPNWKTDFNKIKTILTETLGDLILSVEHIGSTAIPDLDAKSIIDIDVVFEGNVFPEIIKKLQSIGYFHNGNQGIENREVFKRTGSEKKVEILDTISHHLYVCPSHSEELKRHLVFRDCLLANEGLRNEYQKMKYEVAEQVNQNKKAYAKLKMEVINPFIQEIVRQELAK